MRLTANDLHVGQEVVLYDVNRRKDAPRPRGTITKVGRKLVTIRGNWGGRPRQYRIDEQRINDNYGHSSFATLEQDAASEQRRADLAVLSRHGFKLEWNAKPSDDDLRAVAAILEQRESP